MKHRFTRVGLPVLLLATVAAGVLATSGSGQTGESVVGDYRYTLDVDDLDVGTFTKLTGRREVELQESSTNSGPNFGRFHAKPLPEIIILRRPISSNLALHGWHDAVRYGDRAQSVRDATLTAYGPDGDPVARWGLVNAQPIKIEVTERRGTEELIETVTLAADELHALPPR